ncbi:MAG: hypothetical protein HZB39_17715 [Planctomycetes bacterium]|nr:hypothetical protein [Planctomycetota bacterium]
MNTTRSALALIALAASSAAQADNEFAVGTGYASFTSRGSLPAASAGDVCLRFPATDFASMGQFLDAATNRLVRRLTAINTVIQDQSGVTRESFTIALLAGDPFGGGGPDPNPASGDIIRLGPFSTPQTTVSTPVAWTWSTSFATPFDALPARADFFLAVGLPGNPLWPADGLSVHGSGWALGGFNNGDLPYLGAGPIPPFAWAVDRSGASPMVSSSQDRVHNLVGKGPGAFLRLGADVDPLLWPRGGPIFGVAGIYPGHGAPRLDGLAFHYADALNAGRTIVVIGAFGGFATPIALGPWFLGELCLPPSAVLPVSFLTGIAGPRLRTTIFPWPNRWARSLGRMSFQAIALDPTTGLLHASNGASFDSR